MSSHLFFFFPLSLSLSQGHMKQNNGGQRPILACFGSHIGQNRVLLVCFSRNQTVSSILAPVSVGIGPNRSQSAGFVPNRAELKKKGESAHRTSDSTSGRVRCGCGGPEVAPMLSN